MITKITIDKEESQFVIAAGNSTSCLAFDGVFHQAQELLRRLRSIGGPHLPIPPDEQVLASEIGTEAQYHQHHRLLAMYSLITDKQSWFDARTPTAVQTILERYRRSRLDLRVYIGDPVSGRDGLYEFDTIGTIERNAGPMCVPKLVPKGQHDGGSIVTHAVVRLQDPVSNADIYRHPNYHTPEMKLMEVAAQDLRDCGITHDVMVMGVDGSWSSMHQARSLAKAAHWIAFMHGFVHNLYEAEI